MIFLKNCIANKILCILNEASGKDTLPINEKIKNAITRNINNIEKREWIHMKILIILVIFF